MLQHGSSPLTGREVPKLQHLLTPTAAWIRLPSVATQSALSEPHMCAQVIVDLVFSCSRNR